MPNRGLLDLMSLAVLKAVPGNGISHALRREEKGNQAALGRWLESALARISFRVVPALHT